MSTRLTSPDTTSASGVSYPAGSASSSTLKSLKLSQDIGRSAFSLLGKSGAFNGHAVEVWADGAVWDTVSNKYLYPGTDYNVHDVQRS